MTPLSLHDVDAHLTWLGLTPARSWVWPVANVSALAHDGDTTTVDVDMGRGIAWMARHANVRLAGINAPELTAKDEAVREAAYASRDFLRKLIPVDTPVALVSVGYDKYEDRVDAVVIRLVDGANVNELMISSGHATPYHG